MNEKMIKFNEFVKKNLFDFNILLKRSTTVTLNKFEYNSAIYINTK